jgi:hypothetical protein
MSGRQAVARQKGFDESMADKVMCSEVDDVSPRHEAALRLADTMMTLPSLIDDGLREQLQTQFTEEQILELTLLIMKWSHQKIKVALGIDEPFNSDGLSRFKVQDNGSIAQLTPVE